MAFSELLARSCYSFLRGASHPEELVEASKALGISSLGICDRNGLYGAVKGWGKAKELGYRIHVGVEVTLAPIEKAILRDESSVASASSVQELERVAPVVTLLVRERCGYTNLCKLLTASHAGLPKGVSFVEPEMLKAHSAGLALIVPMQLGYRSRSLSSWRPLLEELFFDVGFLASTWHADGSDDQRRSILQEWQCSTPFPIIASCRPLYHSPARKPLADIVRCIRTGTTLDAAGSHLAGNAQACLSNEAQLLALRRYPQEWIDNTQLAAELLQFNFNELKYQFPCELDEGESADQRLTRLTWEGAGRRYPRGVPPGVTAQLRKELGLIEQLQVAPYFLCTWEIVEIARKLEILCQGRGSAANSAVCFALGITAVDPARSNLLFERFLSAERAEPPDIDIDFEHERREEVIQEIYRRYGRDRAAMVSEVICYRGKSALREVGKVFGLSIEQVNHLTGAITHWDSAQLSEPRLREYGFDVADARLRQTVKWAKELEGFPRHLSIHVGGFVLSKHSIHEVAPVEPAAMAGRTVVPWDKDDIDALGFFKVDVLALGMLTAIRKGLHLVHADGGLRVSTRLPRIEAADERFDPLEVVTRVPTEDPAVYALASEADTVGVFQIESRAQMAMLPRLRPQKFYDLVVEVALVRPGPIQGGMVHPYLRRRNGEEPVTVPHESLWPILERTLGVPLFQEQVMQLSITGAGYSPGEADQLRRDMAAWKKSGRLLRHRDRLLQGFAKHGIARHFGEALFEQIKGFGEYGFPESHAASFALLVYLSAWLKAHYPAHFLCALLNSQPMGFYSPSSLIKDGQKHGVEVRPVDVVHSDWDTTLENRVETDGSSSTLRAVRLGLRQLNGFRANAAARIVAARNAAAFLDMEDLIKRAGLEPHDAEILAESGALQTLCPGRRQALWKAKSPRSGELFEDASIAEPPVQLPSLTRAEQLVMDYSRLGFSLVDHPLCHLRTSLRQSGVVATAQLQDLPAGTIVVVAGLVLARQRPGTASGVVFMTLEDETGTANLVVFSAVFDRYRLVARHSPLVLARGKLERKLTIARDGEVGRGTPVIHVVVSELRRLEYEGQLQSRSRDFH